MKTAKFFFMAALTLAFAACSNDDNEFQAPAQAGGIPFSATISIDNADSRSLAEGGSGLVATWEVGEKVAVIQTKSGTCDEMEVKSVSGGLATITGSISGTPSNGDPVRVIYPATAADATTGDVKTDLLYTQTGGTLSDVASKYDVRKNATKLKVEAGVASLDGNVKLTQLYSIFKFTLSTLYDVSISASTFTVSDGTHVYAVTTSDPLSDIFIVLPELAPGTYWFTAEKKRVDRRSINYVNKATISSATSVGQYYPIEIKMATTGDEIKLDGKFYKSETSDAVAVIAYVGGMTDAPGYTHGLAIALDELGKMAWTDAVTACEAKTDPIDAHWMLPTLNQWKNMFMVNDSEDSSPGALRSLVRTSGGTIMSEANYWTSTDDGDSYYAWYVNLTYSGRVYYHSTGDKSAELITRACLAF